MIIHVALYRFRLDARAEQIEQFIRELASSTARTGLVSHYLGGQHIALPADDAVPDMVYDFAALWVFANQTSLDDFSRHPIMAACIASYARPAVERLAIVNFAGNGDVFFKPSVDQGTGVFSE